MTTTLGGTVNLAGTATDLPSEPARADRMAVPQIPRTVSAQSESPPAVSPGRAAGSRRRLHPSRPSGSSTLDEVLHETEALLAEQCERQAAVDSDDETSSLHFSDASSDEDSPAAASASGSCARCAGLHQQLAVLRSEATAREREHAELLARVDLLSRERDAVSAARRRAEQQLRKLAAVARQSSAKPVQSSPASALLATSTPARERSATSDRERSSSRPRLSDSSVFELAETRKSSVLHSIPPLQPSVPKDVKPVLPMPFRSSEDMSSVMTLPIRGPGEAAVSPKGRQQRLQALPPLGSMAPHPPGNASTSSRNGSATAMSIPKPPPRVPWR
eukprot:TRINITY_DN11216_c0_g1_i1.p1 TRINITY_DN11216_c0_g1~~TRINITY_DN11216_c0_g1_i1.p1  ORF type:complete len:333 (+),score=66.86 TRINITY_DN11216_c0_g1_i1:326-1324(+)